MAKCDHCTNLPILPSHSPVSEHSTGAGNLRGAGTEVDQWWWQPGAIIAKVGIPSAADVKRRKKTLQVLKDGCGGGRDCGVGDGGRAQGMSGRVVPRR